MRVLIKRNNLKYMLNHSTEIFIKDFTPRFEMIIIENLYGNISKKIVC